MTATILVVDDEPDLEALVLQKFRRQIRDGAVAFEVEGLENYFLRPELARAIVHSGWNLVELKAVGESLEEIFLELTRSEQKAVDPAAAEGALTK